MNAQHRFLVRGVVICLIVFVFQPGMYSQKQEKSRQSDGISLDNFFDSAHHWYDIDEDTKVINPLPKKTKMGAQ